MFLVQRLTHRTRGIYECRIFSPEIELILSQWRAAVIDELRAIR